MDQFVYHDIFDTKGLEYIIVIAFLILIVPAWILLNRPLKLRAKPVNALGILTPESLRIPNGLLFSNNHTWSHLERSGLALVGLDDLLLHLTGGVEVGFLHDAGSMVRKGEVVARIFQDGKKLEITSPITGKIEQVNNAITENPASVNEDPYDSWLYKIIPESWQEETRSFFLAAEARKWINSELSRFKDFLAGTQTISGPGLVLQEGGELLNFPLSELDQEAWTGFQSKFLQD